MSDERALLLTDLVDSTRLTESLGDAAAAALWAAHDRVARERLGAWRGREIDKSDGFLLLFESAADALGYALDYHRALAALDSRLRARAGLYVGPVSLRANDTADVARGAKPFELEGVAKPVAARVMALAAGGQTLLTAAARAALGQPAAGVRIEPVGHWQLKGIADPVALHAVAADGDLAALTTPADGDKGWRVVHAAGRWRPVRETPHNLPATPSSFVGRETERADVLGKLRSACLVTILGTGGLGKTRLAIEVANEALHDFPDGVGWVELAPLSDGALVGQAIASAFGVAESASTSVVDAIAERLDDRRALLVLDNCEHVDEDCARAARRRRRGPPPLRGKPRGPARARRRARHPALRLRPCRSRRPPGRPRRRPGAACRGREDRARQRRPGGAAARLRGARRPRRGRRGRGAVGDAARTDEPAARGNGLRVAGIERRDARACPGVDACRGGR